MGGPAGEWAVDVKDVTPLVGEAGKARCSRPKFLVWFFSILSVCLLLIGTGYWFYWKDVVGLRVMALNTWGIPHTFGSLDKEERMAAIGSMIADGDYDLVMLEELWMRPDHETIKQAVEGKGLYITKYDDLTTGCDGRVGPWGCSGLAVVSKFPIVEANFTKFTQQGSFGSMFSDGEYFAGKGVGRVMVSPRENLHVDVLVTHTISEEANSQTRENQADELVEVIKKSPAHFVILGGDFNAAPTSEGDRTYHTVKEVMTDAFQEIKAALSAWLDPRFATFGNSRNTYTGGKSDPVIYDYIFHKKNTEQAAMIWTNWFYLPFLNKIKESDQSTISLSDHEAVTSHIFMWKE